MRWNSMTPVTWMKQSCVSSAEDWLFCICYRQLQFPEICVSWIPFPETEACQHVDIPSCSGTPGHQKNWNGQMWHRKGRKIAKIHLKVSSLAQVTVYHLTTTFMLMLVYKLACSHTLMNMKVYSANFGTRCVNRAVKD